MLGKPVYSWLLLVIVLLTGVAAWFLPGPWRDRMPVDTPEIEAMSSRARANTESMQQKLGDRLARKATNEQQERMESPLGFALFRKCTEWTDFNDNQPSGFARDHEQQACEEFRHYIETGEVPE